MAVEKTTTNIRFEGEYVRCARFATSDQPFFTVRIPDVARSNGNYVLQFWARITGSGFNCYATLGNVTQWAIISYQSDWKHFVLYFNNCDVSETDGALELNFRCFTTQLTTTHAVYIYHAQLEKGTVYTDWQPNPDDIEETMEEAASHAMDYITQQALFNKLTNNGQMQGIFMRDGQLYVNATYIQSGTFSGARINLGSGTFTVDEQGNVNASSLAINGGSIDLGNGAFHVSSNGSATASNLGITGGKIELTTTYTNDTPTWGYISIKSANKQSLLSDNELRVGNALSGSSIGLWYNGRNGEMYMWNPSDRNDYIRIDSSLALQYMIKDGIATTIAPDGAYLGMNSSDRPTGVLKAGNTSIYGQIYQYDDYSRQRMAMVWTSTLGQIVLKDSSGTVRVLIDYNGINFYNASGTLVKGI